jgi:hypothetical protein
MIFRIYRSVAPRRFRTSDRTGVVRIGTSATGLRRSLAPLPERRSRFAPSARIARRGTPYAAFSKDENSVAQKGGSVMYKILLALVAAVIWLLMVGTVASGQTPPPDSDNVLLTGYLSCGAVNAAPGDCTFGLHYIDLHKGRTYEIRMDSSDFTSRLVLENEAGLVLAEDSDFLGPLDGSIVFRAPATATYRLIASAAGPANGGSYMITVRELPVIASVEDEMTDGVARTHAVTLLAGRSYVIDLDSARFEPFVKLLNAHGAIIAFAEERETGRPMRIVFTAPRTEEYQLVAAATTPAANGPFALTVCER